MGVILFGLGEYLASREHLGQALTIYDPQQHHHALIRLRGVDGGASAIAYDACCLWCLGYVDRATSRREEAIALARLLRKQGRAEEAMQALAPVFNWFTEGLDSPDLVEARILLDELVASSPNVQSTA